MRNQMTFSHRLASGLDGVEVEKILSPKPVVKTKTEALRKLLLRRKGATVAQIQKCLIWQPHTVRAAISRLRTSGVTIELDRSGRVARYRALSMEIAQ
jgi:hypothetical protein